MERVREIIKKNRNKIMIVIGILLVITLGVSYAYFSNSGVQSKYNTFRSGCLSITITEESDAISLDKVIPVTIEEGLTNEPYTFTIKNNCSEAAPYQVSLESIDKVDTTMGIENIHVSLEDIKGRRITERLDKLEETIISNENGYDARKIYNGELAGGASTDFKFRMWLDYEATKESAASKTYKSKIVISAKDNINKDDEIIKIRYEELESEKGVEDWYKSYITKVSITDRKDEEIKARYCVGKERCEPNIEVELENKEFTYNYENGSNILCTEASDSKGNRSEVVCNSIIKVDNKKPTIEYKKKEEEGNNNWYQKLKLEVVGSDSESGIEKLKYCITTEEECIPTIESEEASVIIDLASNANAQKICSEAIDRNGNESGVVCSETYKVDTTTTTTKVSVGSSSAGSNNWYKELSLKIEGINEYSGISSVKYCVTTEESCSPTTIITNGGSVTLNSNASAQKVCAQSIDNRGLASEVVCSESYKVDTTTTTITMSLGNNTAGSNGWYKALSIKAQGNNSYSGVSSMKYCTTTSSTCSPSTSIEGDNVTVLLNTNASGQRVCAQAIDNKGEASEVLCSNNAYKVDEANPSVAVSVASSTAGSNGWYKALSIKGIASDTGSGVASFKYCTTTSSTCSPTTAISGTTGTVALSSNASAQKVCYQATDTAGRTSGVICSSAYKVDTSTTTTTMSVGSSTAGSNGWYKALSIKLQGNNSYSGISSVKYCTTTSSTCTPTTAITNGGSVALSSNASAQRVCAQATDNKGTTSTVVCSSAYSVDKTVPTVSITSTSATTSSITMNISGNDAHSKISTYYYKIGTGSYTSATTTSKTFTGLTAGTSYTVYVYAVDKAGNQSAVASKSVTTKAMSQNTLENLGLTVSSGTPDFSKTACNSTSTCETTNGLYKSQDDDGDTYYFRGTVTNNYVKFAGFYWRIIRINGDGTIRIIYDGTSAHANGTKTTDSIAVSNVSFGLSSKYWHVGFKYTDNQVHGLETKSNALTELEKWYTANLASYASKIDTNAGFCGDRSMRLDNGSEKYSVTGTESSVYYSAWYRLTYTNYQTKGKEPILTCQYSSDLYTVSSANKGNKSLTYPIGLITADEVVMAGGASTNNKYYLYNGQDYWAITPYYYTFQSPRTAGVYRVITHGGVGLLGTGIEAGLRPVINLKADAKFTGSGTMTDPYVVS